MAFKLSRAYRISAILITGTAALVAMSCGEEDSKKTAPAAPTTTVKYADISAFVNQNCANAGCHSGTSPAENYNMATRAGIATKAAISVTRIENGTMPPSPQKAAHDADTTNAAKLLEWLKAGAPE